MEGDRDNPSYRPDPVGQDTNYGRPFLGRPGKIVKKKQCSISFHGMTIKC